MAERKGNPAIHSKSLIINNLTTLLSVFVFHNNVAYFTPNKICTCKILKKIPSNFSLFRRKISVSTAFYGVRYVYFETKLVVIWHYHTSPKQTLFLGYVDTPSGSLATKAVRWGIINLHSYVKKQPCRTNSESYYTAVIRIC